MDGIIILNINIFFIHKIFSTQIYSKLSTFVLLINVKQQIYTKL
jgi:hypothetical protein